MNDRSLAFTYLIMFLVMIVWGFNFVMLKILVDYFPPVTMTSIRILLAGIVNFGIIIFYKQIKKMTKREWTYILIGAIFGVTGHHAFLAHGLVTTEAKNAVLIMALLPVTTAIFTVIFLGDRLSKWRSLGIALAFIGVIFIQGGGGSWELRLDEIYIFIAMILQAISIICIKKASHTMDSKQITAFTLFIGSIGLFVVSQFVEPGRINEMGGAPIFLYIVLLISAIVATALGHLIFNAAVQRIGAGQSAIFNNFVPFFGLASAAIFLGEKIYWYQSFGFIFIVAGVLFGSGYVEAFWLKSEPMHEKKVKKGV